MSALFAIHNYINPNTTVRTAAQVTAHASYMINRTGTLFNYACGEDRPPPSYQEYDEASDTNQKEEYIDDLSDQYKNKQKFRDEIINFVGDETELGNEKILEKR